MSLPPSFFDHFEDRLNLAVFDINHGDDMALLDFNPGDVQSTLQRIKERQAAAIQKLAELAIKSDHVGNRIDQIADEAHKQLDAQLAEAAPFANLPPEVEVQP